MCLGCAVPVRGGAVGTECLATALGPDLPEVVPPAREPGERARSWTRIAFATALLATLLPWSRFGAGSEPFGAWSDSLRWSMLAATAAAVGLAIAVARKAARRPSPVWDRAAELLAVLVVSGSLMAVARPPAFTSPWLGPWIAAAAGLAALGSISLARRGARERNPVHV